MSISQNKMNKWLLRIGVSILLLVFAGLIVLGYSYFIEPRLLTLKKAELKIPRWSKSLDGFKVVAISDIHAGSNGVTEKRLDELVENANAQKPDLIVLLGDFISERNSGGSGLKIPVEKIAKKLAGFRAKYGVFAVIGNHDWWYDEKKITLELEKNGIEVLENRVKEIRVNGEVINLWGIEDYWKKHRVPTVQSYDLIQNKINIIALTHNPDSLLKAPNEISTMIAGHSHGGQIKFPFYGAYPFVNDGRFMEGEAIVDGKHVFVTTGVGTSGPPIRFRVPPEIAVLELYSE